MSGPGDQSFVVIRGPAGSRFSEIRWFSEIDSTNRYLIDAARAGAPEGLVVAADHQHAGRGRLGRRWDAPPGRNLLVSILLRPDVPAASLQLCTAAVAMAAVSACAVGTGLEPSLKWPNDLIVGARKLAGVLAEFDGSGTGPPALVVGIGLNVAWPAPAGEAGEPEVPAELRDAATSLWRETGIRHDPRALLDLLLRDLEPRVADLATTEGRRRQSREYRRRCATLGQRVRVDLDGESVTGDTVDVTPEGHLVIDLGTCFRTVTAGDVVHLRAQH
jgi:BirA family biotin operon repressor/biotin-[acetyl-CoA-carboxylase] ligase